MFSLLLLVTGQIEKPFSTPILAFANAPIPDVKGEPVWERTDFPFARTERPKENNRSANAQVEWMLKGSNLKVVCPTTQDPVQAGATYLFADERPDEADSADNKLGACRYGCVLTKDTKALSWYKSVDWKAPYPEVAQELARYWHIAKEFEEAKPTTDKDGLITYLFRFGGQKTGRLGDVTPAPWIGRLRVRATEEWVTASFVELRDDEDNRPAAEFWNSSLLSRSSDPKQDAGKAATNESHETNKVRAR